MRVVGKIVGVLLTLIAVPLLILAACSTSIERTLRDAETYANVLESETIFESLIPVTLPAVLQNTSRRNQSDLEIMIDSPVVLQDVTNALDADEWREVANSLISPSWLQARTNQIFGATLSIIEGDLSVLDEPFDLKDLRQRLTGVEAQEAAELIITSAAECNRTQSDQILPASRGDGRLPICNPADDELREVSMTVITNWFALLAESLESDTPTVGEFLDLNTDDASSINVFMEFIRQGFLLMFLCPLALLSLVVVAAIRSAKGLGRWLGSAFIIAGIGLMLVVILTQVAAIGIIAENLNNAQNEVEVFLGRLAGELLSSAFSNASGTMLMIMAIYIVIGFILFAATWVLTRYDDDDGEIVLIGEDGSIISTASKQRIGQLNLEESQP